MSDSDLKSEPMDTSLVDFESEFLQLCRQYPNGVSHKIVQNSFPNVSSEECLQVINRLLLLEKIDLLKSSTESETLLYRIRNINSSINAGNKPTDQMEKLVYEVVKESRNLGIWIRDIRVKTKLTPTILNKTLKILENKKLIKAVKSVHANKRKVYMLYELIPDSTITGGPWITDNCLDEEFVRILNEQCIRLLDERLKESIEKYSDDPFLRRTNSFLSSSELVSFINQMGFSRITLTIEHIESILDTLIYDGKIEKMTVATSIITTNKNDKKSNLYRSIKSIMNSALIVRNPCGISPIFNDCHDDGLVTPSTCTYLNNWLTF